MSSVERNSAVARKLQLNVGMIFPALLLCLATGAAQAPPDPGGKWKIEVKLTIEEKEGQYVFVLAGSADTPPGTIFRGRVYVVDLVDDFKQGKREDEEPLVWEGDGEADQPGFRNVEPKDGKFRVEVYRFARRPWALRYRGRVHYLPHIQAERAVVDKMGQEEFSRASELAYGNAELHAAQLKERAREILDDLLALEVLFNELRKSHQTASRKPDLAAWKSWKDAWYGRLERINERNRERYGMWAVWMERQAKMRVGGLAELLRQLLVVCTEHLEGQAGALERAQRRFDHFTIYYEEAIEVIGVDAPLDIDRIAPAVADYERGLGPLRAWIEGRQGDAQTVYRQARRAGAASLLRLLPPIQNRKRAYKYVNDISAGFARLLELVEAGADAAALKPALEEHDRAVAEFKTFAGIK